MFDLAGKNIIIIGGNKGIGFAYAESLLENQAKVTISGTVESENLNAIKKLQQISEKVSYINFDVTNIEFFCDYLQSKNTIPNVLFLNQGMLNFEESWNENTINESVQINLTRSLEITEIFVNNLIKNNQSGKVIYTASIAGILGMPLDITYGASKAGLINAAKSYAVKYGKYGITFNTISPGWIDTNMYKKIENLPFSDKLKETIISRTPLKRVGETRDLKGVATFLSSSESDYITGANIVIDGGFSIG